MNTDAALARLVPAVREVHRHRKDALDRARAEAQAEAGRPDLLWHMLLQSFATMGNSRGQVGLIQTLENYDRLRYHRLASLDPAARRAEIQNVCRRAGIRMPDKKASWLAAGFDRIAALGGPDAADAARRALPGRAEKTAFLRQFAGIGPKYARNIHMDIYDEDFLDSIAVDVRIQSISKAVGVSFRRPYPEHEQFYLAVAQATGLSGWELDRLLYNFAEDVRARVGAAS